MIKNILLTFVLCNIILLSYNAQHYNALFIGNSYTGVNNLPSLISQLATSLNNTLDYESNTPGGYTLQGHSTNTTTLNKIEQGTWDFVILQDQSQRPSFPPSQVATEVYPYAQTLVDSIKAANVCAEPLFYMTWGRENGDQQNCQFYAPLCTYEGMQDRLRISYLEMAVDNSSSVSPVGAAWKYTRDNYPSISLYSADESHPSIEGSYLAACVFYSSIFRKSPENATFTAGLSTTNANILQTVAKLIVIDSLETWRIGANNVTIETISHTYTNSTYQFLATTTNATYFKWDFGNGETSTDENPSITFNNSGTYTITLIADDGCSSDTLSTSINISTTGILENKLTYKLTQDNSQLEIEFLDHKTRKIAIYDLNGRLLQRKSIYSKNHIFGIEKLPFVFLIIISENNNRHTIKISK